MLSADLQRVGRFLVKKGLTEAEIDVSIKHESVLACWAPTQPPSLPPPSLPRLIRVIRV